MDIWSILIAIGAPSAIMGLFVWWIKRKFDKFETKRDKQNEDLNNLMVIMMQMGRANNVLAVATAKAVQRIPDAHCNGDMDEALAKAYEIQDEQKDFLIDKGIEHIFSNGLGK